MKHNGWEPSKDQKGLNVQWYSGLDTEQKKINHDEIYFF